MQHTGSPFLSGCISFTPWVLILPLPFSAGLETFSQLVWKSAEGTVSMNSPRGLCDFLQNLSCLALDRVLMAPDCPSGSTGRDKGYRFGLYRDTVIWVT